MLCEKIVAIDFADSESEASQEETRQVADPDKHKATVANFGKSKNLESRTLNLLESGNITGNLFGLVYRIL